MQSVRLGDNIPLIYFNIHGKQLPRDAWANAPIIPERDGMGDGEKHGESRGTGKVFIYEQGRNTSFDGFLDDIADAGYHLVFVGRRNAYSAETGQTHYVLRYVWRRTPHDDERTRRLSARILLELKEWGRTSLWNIIAHQNPFYRDGKPVDGLNLVSIDLNSRDQLTEFRQGKETPAMRWLKDSQGNRVGDAPFPLKPATYLGLDDGKICLLVEAEDETAKVKAALLAEREAAILAGKTEANRS